MNAPLRYQGKPLLRLLECYVLKAIGKLSDDEATKLAAMQQKLRQVYGGDGPWDQIISMTMKLPENMPMLIRQSWDRNQQIANSNGLPLTPQHFAEMFVDANLA